MRILPTLALGVAALSLTACGSSGPGGTNAFKVAASPTSYPVLYAGRVSGGEGYVRVGLDRGMVRSGLDSNPRFDETYMTFTCPVPVKVVDAAKTDQESRIDASVIGDCVNPALDYFRNAKFISGTESTDDEYFLGIGSGRPVPVKPGQSKKDARAAGDFVYDASYVDAKQPVSALVTASVDDRVIGTSNTRTTYSLQDNTHKWECTTTNTRMASTVKRAVFGSDSAATVMKTSDLPAECRK